MSVRFGIVGCGAISEDMHIPTLQACTGVELIAAVDSDLGHAREVAMRHGIPESSSDIASLRGRVDAVVVCTPPQVRPRLLEQAFAVGLDVFAEKPLANTSSECERINLACREAGRILAVSHMYRFYPVRARMHELAAMHDLGEIKSVEIHEGAPYAWLPRSGYTFKRGEVSGGVVINAGVHSLDSFIQWFGDPQILSYEDDAIGGLESNARARLAFPGGVSGDFRISRTCRLPSLFRIGCERGALEFSNRDTVAYRVLIGGKASAYCVEGEVQTTADCWRLQLADFLNSLETRQPPRVDGAEATRVVSLVDALYSLKHSRPFPAAVPQPGATW